MNNLKCLPLVFIQLVIIINGCTHDINKFSDFSYKYQVSYNPYAQVDWSTTKKCLSQHHDHTNAQESKIREYDLAGYNAIVILHYSGVKSLSYTRQERLWPLTNFLSQYSSDEEFLATSQNIKFFFPGMEEVGRHHMTSPFLTKYIAVWEPGLYPRKENWHYTTSQECINLIYAFGGFSIIAHPTRNTKFYRNLTNHHSIEIYNAFYRFKFRIGEHKKDKNEHFLKVWDNLLTYKSSRIWGYAVNDWYGPWNHDIKTTLPDVYDSGKTLALVKEYTLESYRASLEQGAFFAIKDIASQKGLYPEILHIEVTPDSIIIHVSNGEINWITCGVSIERGQNLDLNYLPKNITYVRAEVSNENGTVYVQPFSLKEVLRGHVR